MDVTSEATGTRRFLTDAVASGHIVEAHRLETPVTPAGRAGGVLFRQVVPVVTYPYEWTFSMLRDAALLLVRLLRAGLDDGVMCTSGSAFDVQFWGARPVVVGVGAFRPRFGREPWPGYRSFCRTFLYPLLLTARGGIPFQPVLRASPEGIAPLTMARILTPGDSHPDLAAGGRPPIGLLPRVGFGEWRDEFAAAVEAADVTAARLEELVESLGDGVSGGDDVQHHRLEPPAVADARDRFVAEALDRIDPATVLDLSCADGRHARVAADHGAAVVALDPNQARVERLYRSLREDQTPTILPLLVDRSDPGPSLPWPERGQIAFVDRIGARLVLCLDPVPGDAPCRSRAIAEVVDLLVRFDAPVVIELTQDLVAPFAHHGRSRFVVVRHQAVPVPDRTARRYLLELAPALSLG